MILNLSIEKNYMVICDTNIISKLLFRDPLVLKQIDMIGLKNIYITPIIYRNHSLA